MRLDLYLKKEDTRFRISMLVQERVVMSLHILGSGDGLQNIGDIYEMYKNVLSKIVRKFCRVVRKHLQPIFIQTPNES